MDSVSVETSPENEWIKQRIVDGKVSKPSGSSTLKVFRPRHVPSKWKKRCPGREFQFPLQAGRLSSRPIMYLCHISLDSPRATASETMARKYLYAKLETFRECFFLAHSANRFSGGEITVNQSGIISMNLSQSDFANHFIFGYSKGLHQLSPFGSLLSLFFLPWLLIVASCATCFTLSAFYWHSFDVFLVFIVKSPLRLLATHPRRVWLNGDLFSGCLISTQFNWCRRSVGSTWFPFKREPRPCREYSWPCVAGPLPKADHKSTFDFIWHSARHHTSYTQKQFQFLRKHELWRHNWRKKFAANLLSQSLC